MKYFVLTEDGRRFGPADVATLNMWAQQSRLGPSSILQEETTGRTLTASQVPGLIFPFVGTVPPPGQSSYYRDMPAAGSIPGNTELILAWVFGAISIVFCPLGFGIAGIVLASVAKSKGHPKATAALAFTICAFIVGMALGIAVQHYMWHGRRFF